MGDIFYFFKLVFVNVIMRYVLIYYYLRDRCILIFKGFLSVLNRVN